MPCEEGWQEGAVVGIGRSAQSGGRKGSRGRLSPGAHQAWMEWRGGGGRSTMIDARNPTLPAPPPQLAQGAWGRANAPRAGLAPCRALMTEGADGGPGERINDLITRGPREAKGRPALLPSTESRPLFRKAHAFHYGGLAGF